MKPTLSLLFVALAMLFLASSANASSLNWKPCHDRFECTMAKVPLDHSRPHGRKIELALIRARAADPATKIGSVFIHPGGPGASGVDNLRNAPPPAIAAITRRFDAIGIDTRGSAHSRPVVDCKVDEERAGVYAQPFVRPETLDVGDLVDDTTSYLKRCMKLNGDLLEHVSSADVARDLDLLRAAVGDKQLNFIGHSYATLYGATYASMFPGRVRSMVLDSPMDAETWVHRPFDAMREQTAGLEDSLSRYFGVFGAQPFDDLQAQLDHAPLGPLDGDDLPIAAMEAVFSRFDWPVFADAIAQAHDDDPAALRALVDGFYSGDAFNSDLMVATQALDQRYPNRVRPFLRAGRRAAALFPHFAHNSGYSELSYGLLPVSDRSAYHGPFRNSKKSGTALVIGTTHDPYTPYAWAPRLTHDLGNARLLTYNGDGHGSITDLNPCIIGHVLGYLEAGVLPPTGASCDQQI
jgi:pimeloyl-ACP methyl ester carboxylesterase